MASPDKKSFALRLDPALWAEVERLAAQELRSANAQIEYLLREALARRGIKPAVNRSPRGRPPKDGSSAEPGSEAAESSEG
ncbi:type II toxin-antitoxin system antitoxin [Kinneretia aquatilis]|uniref:toxin-antitoxin system HicB family antitoxin n=1 Tax=Kinneretia aquatilis TaxID=2070761 RepID=UPI0014951FC5|nr:toxin-antitoxin system HicB family antitoxin [Paucibacter aquatile]WIV98533.1 hypothetical protein K9V56_003225 [Paucibacter aquatile]